MKIHAIALCLVVLIGAAPAFTQGQLTGLRLTGEQALGQVKIVSGRVVPADVASPWAIGVWVNGISGQVSPTGDFRVMIPAEDVMSVLAFQPGYNVTVIALAQAEGGMKQAVLRGAEAIRDLLKGGESIRDLLKTSEGIRDLLKGAKGSSDGIRDLLDHGKGSSDGIRDLLTPTHVSDDGIRDLLPLKKPEKPGANDNTVQTKNEGIRDLLPR